MKPIEILEKHLPDWNVYLTESGVKKMIAAMEEYAEQKNISSNLSVSRSSPTSLEGCPFNYCDSSPKCEGKCRYA